MKVCLTLTCLFLLTALQDGETLIIYREKEGGSITVRCEFRYSGEKRFLCKETCEGKNILIVTTKDTDQTGRFSIRYEKRNIFSFDFLHVSITDLKPSDSGRYRCRSDETIDGTLYDDFYLVVTEDSSEPKWTQRPFLGSTFLPTVSTTTKRTTRTSRSFSLSPSETIKLPEKPAAAPGPLLYVGLVLVVLFVFLAAALLIFFKRKNFSQQKGPPEETEYANFSKAKDGAVEYSEVHFLKAAPTSADSAPCGHAENVTYSEIQMNFANRSDDSALYSNISLQQ
ncbi:natural cytotoxicity triggering receptor 2-like [Xiphophorus maculatus]|uniref:natural cytotoxicity triggering receptor 2-like n=1 Tax=Xiphophorus maculatus TaxID=8083 RepID=UPI000C6C9DD2|nr:natural cytotoxicity triggering receptor 2-like [Xiphophorus maculatus]